MLPMVPDILLMPSLLPTTLLLGMLKMLPSTSLMLNLLVKMLNSPPIILLLMIPQLLLGLTMMFVSPLLTLRPSMLLLFQRPIPMPDTLLREPLQLMLTSLEELTPTLDMLPLKRLLLMLLRMPVQTQMLISLLIRLPPPMLPSLLELRLMPTMLNQ
jgi:hypothetical protein